MKNFLFCIIAICVLLFVACDKNVYGVEKIEQVQKSDSEEQKIDSASSEDNSSGNNSSVADSNPEYKIDSALWFSFKDSFSLVSYKDSSYWLSYRSDSNHVTIKEWVSDGSGMGQGFDVFGNYLFGFAVSMRDYKVSDLFNRTYLGYFSSSLGFVQARHANCQNFTASYYAPNDLIPLLLVSGSESVRGIDLRGVAYLIRINIQNGVFVPELVQTIITLPGTYKDSDGHDYPFGGYSNIMVDRETGHFYVINGSNIYEMEQPSLFDERGNVVSESYLTVDNVIRRIGLKYKTRFPQGASINNGLAYIASGTGDSYLQIVDLSTGKELNSVHLSDIGFNLEPEDVAFWQNSMILSGGSTHGIYRVYWE